jgi:hypothetical protein
LKTLGNTADSIDSKRWGTWTGSVPNRQTTADEVLGGMREQMATK